jgi:D-beta-D-heptose 7-phosphate kinase/D-beta-D-heptose 1-phosphate adenosyltransferase
MRIVWVNGCFDTLHLGHIELLKFAKSRGDLLFVGIDSDARIRQSKGEQRPIQDEKTRFTILSNLKVVDNVCIFDTDYQLERLIADYNVVEIVIGDDYKDKTIIGSQYCENITFFPRIEQYSTTKIVEKIMNLN